MKLYEVNQAIEALLMKLDPDPETGEITTTEDAGLQTVCFPFIMTYGKRVISMEADYSTEWANLTPEEKKRKLYEKQKAHLDTSSNTALSRSNSTIRASAI